MKQRIVTGLLALPVLLGLVGFAGPFLFTAFVTLSCALGLREVYAMLLPEERSRERLLAMLLGAFLLPVLVFWPGLTGPVLVLAVVLAAFWFLFHYQDLNRVISHLGAVVLGWLYLAVPLAQLALLHALPQGPRWVFLVLAIVFAGDTFAYFVGIRFGRHRLYEAISPKKSIEGALGGLGGSVLAALLGGGVFLPQAGAGNLLLLGIVLGAVGQAGDLFESMLKRAAGVKDSGTLFPGHGGILDRLDSLIFAFPLLYLYLRLFPGA